MIYSSNQSVRASMADTKANLSILGTFQIIQDAITELTGQYDVDNVSLKKNYNAFWVFTKTKIKFFKKIQWSERITVNSFISFISTVKINIDVEIINKDNEIAAYSKTELCALDKATQKIRKLSTVGIEDTMLEDKQSVEIEFSKFIEKDLPVVDRVKIKYTNIDFSHHTNNLEYVRVIMNTYSVEQIENKDIKEIEIIYLNQSFENDVLDVKKANSDYKDLIVLEKESRPVVKCEIVF